MKRTRPTVAEPVTDRSSLPLPRWAAAVGLVMLACLAHGRAVRNGFIWDDDFYVTENKTLRSLDGLRQIWFEPLATPQYYPLVHTTYWIEYRLWELDPAGYHAVNVVLHAASSVALWALLRKLAVPAAWFGAALFAVHPVGVESVAWVTERKNTLSMLLAILAARCWLQYRFGRGPIVTDAVGGPANLSASLERNRWLIVAIVLFALALLSKTVSAMLVGMLLVVVWWKTAAVRRVDIVGLLPLVVIGLPLAMVTVWLEKHHVGAIGVDFDFSWPDRVLIAGRAAAFYLTKLMWPQSLAFFYPRWEVDRHVPWQWLFPITVAAVMACAWRYRETIGRAPVAAAAMYGCGLFPALGFFDVYPFKYSFVADHFQYHAMPVALAAGAAATTQLGRWRRTAVAIRPTVVGVLALLALQRCGVFHDLESLYLDTLAKNPACAAAAHNLGSQYMFEGRSAEAEYYLRRGVDEALFLDERSRSLASLALLAMRRGASGEAVDLAQEAERQHSTRRARGVLALALVRSGNVADGMTLIDAAGADATPEMRMAAAECALMRHDLDAALASFATFVEREDPDEKNSALLEAGVSLAEHSFFEEAVAMLEAITGNERRLAKAQVNIGVCRAKQGRLDEALKHFRNAARIDPRSAEAHGNIGKALAASGRRDEAIAAFEAARALSPAGFAFEQDLVHAQRMPSTPPRSSP